MVENGARPIHHGTPSYRSRPSLAFCVLIELEMTVSCLTGDMSALQPTMLGSEMSRNI